MVRSLDPRRFLALPWFYSWFSEFIYPHQRHVFATEHVRARRGDRILDIGCGPADLLSHLPAGVEYVGFDPSPAYIRHATRRFGARGRFHCGYVDRAAIDALGAASFDLVVAHGVLHHLDDAQVRQFFVLAHAALRPGGRLITSDGCYTPSQSRLARLVLSLDRGLHVRTREAYTDLARHVFGEVAAFVRDDTFRIPYTMVFLECVRARG